YVSRNPAVQLGIDDRVGALEPGLDGDFVVWSAHPLSDFAVCEQTWIDGTRYFSRETDLAARAAAEELRRKLLLKAATLRRLHDLDTNVADKGSWPGTTLGRRFGMTEEEAGLDVAQGLCEIGRHDHAGHDHHAGGE
ncbi:MAG: amidohydrolase family protein, partial [Gemmatimonadetes bacterium]|nr:amidohydrolase family protein [Gemmatimonadota bacterium]